MMASIPYRLQVFVDDELRAVLRDIAHEENISLQKLVVKWLHDKAREHPKGQHLASSDDA